MATRRLRYPPPQACEVGAVVRVVRLVGRSPGESRALAPYIRREAAVLRAGTGARQGHLFVRYGDGAELWVRKAEVQLIAPARKEGIDGRP